MGAILKSPFRAEIAVLPRPKVRIANRQIYRAEAALNGPDAEWSINPHDSSAAQFSILDQLEGMGRSSDGKFLFELYWPDLEDSPKGPRQMWKQTSNPVTAVKGAAVSGYEAVDAPYTEELWGGLERSDQYWEGRGTLLDGSTTGNNDRWWYAVGSRLIHRGGIPGPGVVVAQTELYVHTPCADL